MQINTFNNSVVNAVKDIKGCQFAHLTYVSEPSLNKAQKAAITGTTEPIAIEKIASGIVQLNYSYENAVNNRGEKEQGEAINFVAAPLRWGTWVENQVNKLIEHKGDLYLRFYGVQNSKMDCSYFVGGKFATAEQVALIKQYTEREQVKSQASAGLTENQVIARCVKIDNILEITINGTEYKRKKPTYKAA